MSHGNNSTAVAVVAAEVQAAAEAEIGSDADAVLQISNNRNSRKFGYHLKNSIIQSTPFPKGKARETSS